VQYEYQGDELSVFQHAVNWKAYFGSQLRPYVRGRVLEVGGGIGATARLLCDGRQESWDALEPDPRLAEEMGRRFAEAPLPAPTAVRVGTVADLGRDERFDAILYIDVLEHIDRDRDELAAAAALLRPGGALAVLSPAHQWLYTPFDRAIGHFRRYSRTGLAALTPPGLRREKIIYLDAVGMLASLGNRLLLRSATPTRRQVWFWDAVLVRLSRLVDPLLGYAVGKSVLGVWRRP
jgi:SAM-dependent methyltransferase